MPETQKPLPGWKDKVLFTPGPLTTSQTVKQAMLRDVGSRDYEFINLVKDVRRRLLALGGAAQPDYEAVIMQGSGSFGVEAVIGSIHKGGKLLTVVNGAYGRRIAQMAEIHGTAHVELTYSEEQPTDPAALEAALAADPSITHVAAIHCETSTGMFNDIARLGAITQKAGRIFIVDAMSTFGAVPTDLAASGIDFLISSANKCIEGVPGFSFVLARGERLRELKGRSRTLCLDLYAQWEGLESPAAQFRFTPPTHVLVAFYQALKELEAEGGPEARAVRYKNSYGVMREGMRAMGFKEFLAPELQGYIITAYHYPTTPGFDFDKFYAALNSMGYVIYPGKVSQADCFRIGNIGRIGESDMRDLLRAIREVMSGMNT